MKVFDNIWHNLLTLGASLKGQSLYRSVRTLHHFMGFCLERKSDLNG